MKKILYGIMVKNKLVGIDQSLNVCFQDFDFGEIDYLPLYYDKKCAEQLLKYIKEDLKCKINPYRYLDGHSKNKQELNW